MKRIIEKLRAGETLTASEINLLESRLRRRFWPGLLAWVFLFCALAFGISAQETAKNDTLESPLLSVNGKTVSVGEYLERLEQQKVVVPGKEGETQAAANYVLGVLINESIILQLAEREKVMPTDEQVASRLAAVKKSDPDFEKNLRGQAMTEKDLAKSIRYRMAFNNLVVKDVTVTEDDIAKAYEAAIKAKNSPYITPERAKISVIINKDKNKMTEAYKMLNEGAAFGSVAEMFSQDTATNRKRGDAGWISRKDTDELPKIFVDTAFSLTKGKYCAPFKTGNNWVIIRQDDFETMRVKPFDSVKDELREKVIVDKGVKSGKFQKLFAEFVKDAKITLYGGKYKTLYNSVADKVKQQKVL
ncbi:MAG: peptidylprolyl isomerase [Abditibacteriota bacterium]|nr:peptidylprolyl isomerase [Abditibacteriota bacterium]